MSGLFLDAGIGPRGKVGLILPSVQTVTEPLFYRISPKGIAYYTSRVLIRRNILLDHADMEKDAIRAAVELATASVDCIAYCCTGSGILLGIEGDRKFCSEIEKQTTVPTFSALSAMIEALQAMGMKNLVLISPYQAEMHHAEEDFFRRNGFNLLKSRSMEVESGGKYALVPPEEIYRFCLENWDARADGLFISCMNFNAMPCIAPLEKELRKPVLSSHSATLWKTLKMISLHEAISGYGRLLAEGIT